MRSPALALAVTLTTGCSLTREQQAAVVATAGWFASRPVILRIEGNQQAAGAIEAYADTFDEDRGAATVEGTITWAGDPEGACAFSGECVSSEADLTAMGEGTMLEGGWMDELTERVEDGQGARTGHPRTDFPDTQVTFDLSGHAQNAPLLFTTYEFDAFPGTHLEGTVTLGHADPVAVVIDLTWGYGGTDYAVWIDGDLTEWIYFTST